MNFADQRVLKSTPATLSAQFVDQDGVAAVPAGLVTVGIFRADGTVLQAPGAATTVVAGGIRTFALTAAQTALLDHLTCTWTAASGEVVVTHVDVVGGFGFTLADLAALDGMSALTLPRKRDLRQAVEELVEIRTGWLWTRRLVVESFTSEQWFYPAPPWLQYRPLKVLRSVKVGGVAETLTDWSFSDYGQQINGRYGWWSSFPPTTLEVIYEAGEDRPPVSLVQGLLAAAQQEQLDRASAGNGRNLSIVNEFGNITFARATVENLFGNPRVDAVLAAWDRRVPVVM